MALALDLAPGRAPGTEGPQVADGCRTLWPDSRAMWRETQVSGGLVYEEIRHSVQFITNMPILCNES